MPQFLLSVHHPEITEMPAPEELEGAYALVGAFNEALVAADAMVFAGGLFPPSQAKVVQTTDDGTSITDGTHKANDELGGFWVINATDFDAAIEWATKGSAACGHPVQIRQFQGE
jgi:hypothetical protein